MKELKTDIEEMFSHNNLNEDTRLQIELINQSLTGLQSDKKRSLKPRPRISLDL